eukprot:Selendium_serpulae@DN5087_c0_g1_i2.p1
MSQPGAKNSCKILEYQKAMELLECHICCYSMYPPIFQCTEGHTICHKCQKKTHRPNCCPTCGQRNDIRNRALEKLTESLEEIPCANSTYGCNETFPYIKKQEHEHKCSFTPFPCVHLHCTEENGPDELVKHLLKSHQYEQKFTSKLHFVCDGENLQILPEGELLWQKQIYTCFDKHYVLRIRRKADDPPQFYVSLVVLSTKHHPNRYSISTMGNHRKFGFEGPIWSVTKGFHEMERVHDCLILPENIVLFLSGGRGSESDSVNNIKL